MQQFLQTIRAFARKPVAAAALSFFFPGLGQAAAGQRNRGAIVSIPMFAVIGAFLLIAIFDRSSLLGLAVNQEWLTSLLILDVVALIYHMWAVVDSYLVALKAQPKRRRGTPASSKWAATLGVLVILLGTLTIHGSVASVDMTWQHALYCLSAKIPCWVADANSTRDPNATDNGDNTDPNGGGETSIPSASGSIGPIASYDFSNLPSFSTNSDSKNWAADGQLNVLLAGIGVQSAQYAADLGPDTIMVLHVLMSTGQAELISVPRNNYCVPLPQDLATSFPTAKNFADGTSCPAYTYPNQINALPNDVLGNCHKWPVPEFTSTCGQSNDDNRYYRAYKAMEEVIGGLVGLQIDGSLWINPAGLSTLIDALGGVSIDVQTILYDKPCGPVGSTTYNLGSKINVPGNPYCADAHNGYAVPDGVAGVQKMQQDAANSGGKRSIVWTQGHDVAFVIHTGIQHMDGDWALAYARTRIYTSDPQRTQRQQDLLRAIRSSPDLDPCKFASLGNVLPLLSAVAAIPYGFNGDIDLTNPQNLQAWASIAKKITGGNIAELTLSDKNGPAGWVNIGTHKNPYWWPAWTPTSVQALQGPNGIVATVLNQNSVVTGTTSSGC